MNDFSSVEINGKALSDYVISGSLYNGNDGERLSAFAARVEQETGLKLPMIDGDKLPEHKGNYIFLSDTNTDFTNYRIKFEGGNIILFANYYTLDDCIDSFFADVLGGDGIMTEDKVYKIGKSEIYSKEKLMQVLEEIYNDDSRLIIGQHMNQGYPIGEVFDIETKAFMEGCGTEAALYGWDCVGTMIYPKNLRNIESGRVKLAYQMTEYMRQGGIITMSAHFPNPAEAEPQPGVSIKHPFPNGDKDWQDLLTEGTETNKRFWGYIKQLGDLFQIFKENGAPIIFRPFLEHNGGWIWYGIPYKNEKGITCMYPAEYLKTAWISVYDYFVKERGLDNLIWEFAPNVGKRRTKPEEYWIVPIMHAYPGDEYVDMVAVDWYPSAAEQEEPKDLLDCYEDLTKPTGKIFAYGELSAGDNRTVGDNYTFTCDDYANMLRSFTEKGVKSAYALTWSSWGTGENRVKLTMYEMTRGKEFFGNNPGFLDKAKVRKLLYGN